MRRLLTLLLIMVFSSCAFDPVKSYQRKIASPVEFKSFKKLPISKQFTNNEKSNKTPAPSSTGTNKL